QLRHYQTREKCGLARTITYPVCMLPVPKTRRNRPVGSHPDGPSRHAGKGKYFFLFAAFSVAACATVFAGAPPAQAHGVLRTQILYCVLITGLLGTVWWLTMKGP